MENQPAPGKNIASKKTYLLAGGVIAVLLLIIGLLAFAIQKQGPIPEEYAKQVSFPLYFPEKVPEGLQLDRNSFSASPEALVFSFIDENSKRLVVTIQSRPKNLDVSEFNPTREFSTHIGRAYLVDLESRSTGAIVNDKSLVFVNAPDGMPLDSLEELIKSLRRIK